MVKAKARQRISRSPLFPRIRLPSAWLACVLGLGSFGLGSCAGASGEPGSPSTEDRNASTREVFDTGRRLAEQGDSVRAEQYLAAALRGGHDPREALPLLMRVCIDGSRLRVALNHAAPYLKQNPDAIWLRYLVATVYLSLRQPFHAREHLAAIEQRDPSHAPAQYLLGVTEWQAFGNRATARSHFQRYLELDATGLHSGEVHEWLRTNPEPEATALQPSTLTTEVPAPIRLPPSPPAHTPLPEARDANP
jgi:tetratricopeptide (TPR) repeat protein